MKKFAALIFTLLGFAAGAGEAACYGNLLDAMQEQNPRIRAGMLLSAMESSPSSIDLNILKLLEQDLGEKNFDRLLFARLTSLWADHPDNLLLARLCAGLASRYRIYSPENLECFHRTLKHIRLERNQRRDCTPDRSGEDSGQ